VYGRVPLLVTFFKFAVLATGGEVLAHRLRTGRYRFCGFGIVPKMVVWGFLGLAIYAAFGIFSAGVPALFAQSSIALLHTPVGTGFLISVFMNVFFAPVMMLTHHVTDLHIAKSGGTFPLREFHMVPLLANVDWNRMWSFVFFKTIPLFWIPAHTITFLLPPEYRTMFAAALSVALGVFLGVAARRKETNDG
ncbi:MAG: Mpv17/PMP22 family protein, partial [Spirochaeta sp.]|nr:Mpv17/PMP22 family protein [Spirochaeta sp.]